MVFWKRKQIDLGEQSVTELTILEWKRFFSIKLFNFHPTTGKQDRFHTHAFRALSILLSGDYVEEIIDKSGNVVELKRSRSRLLFIPKDSYHRVTRSTGCRTLLITGEWGDEFKELRVTPEDEMTDDVRCVSKYMTVWREYFCGKQRIDLRKGDFKILGGKG
jgi:hypothetical protein